MPKKDKWLILAPSSFNDLKVSNHLIAIEISKTNKLDYVESPGVTGTQLSRILSISLNYLKNKLFRKNNKRNFEKYKNLRIIKKSYLPFIGLPLIDNLLFNLNFQYKNKIYRLLDESDKVLICSPLWIQVYKIWIKNKKYNNLNKTFFHLVDDPASYQHLRFYMQILLKNISYFQYTISPNKILLDKYVPKAKQIHIPHGFNKVLGDSKYKSYKERKPIIVYAGTFADWVDYQLIGSVCKKFQSFKIIIVGKLAKNISYSTLNELRNCHSNLEIMPSMEKHKLHKFLLTCSIAIIPYKSKLLHIQNCSPSKIMDYLGCGLPIVSTYIPYCKNHKFVKVASSQKEFLENIGNYINYTCNKRIKLTQYALDHTWENCINKIKKIV